MSGRFNEVKAQMKRTNERWLVTGAAGFIGSNLVEFLLKHDQRVIGVDNFSTGHKKNLDEVLASVSGGQCERFEFLEGDIQDFDLCMRACGGADRVLHQAARGSVPRSIAEPRASHDSNVTGFLNVMTAARDCAVKSFVYASSSSVYGDLERLPKIESEVGRPLSPYAATKLFNEIYADVFFRTYRMPAIGLRYFNVFGRRQDPNGQYAAVIPRWIASLLCGEPVEIFGDGETSRDFCYIDNVVQMNILAALAPEPAFGQNFNVAFHQSTSLNQLFYLIRDSLAVRQSGLAKVEPVFKPFRPGDIRHSLADISKAQEMLGYRPTHSVADGMREALDWYVRDVQN